MGNFVVNLPHDLLTVTQSLNLGDFNMYGLILIMAIS